MTTRAASPHLPALSAGLYQPEEDPVLLQICTLPAVEASLQRRRRRCSWGMRRGLSWIEELDQRLLCRQEMRERCRSEAERDAFLARPLRRS
jgi:hypothetical protein